jgi:glyoxylase-like metal-dependent hydrolase (beta-lactamase superfamily II)
MKNDVKIKLLDLEMAWAPTAAGGPITLHPVLIMANDGVTLVDTAFPGQFEQLKLAMADAGVTLQQLNRVVLTHQDWDHVGSMGEIINACSGNLEIYAHPLEKPYLEGTLPYIKISPEKNAERLQSLPKERREQAAAMLAAVPTFRVNHTLEDGDVLPFHGGMRVVHTPGHTPGHISLYLEADCGLIPGDELRVENGKIVGPQPEYTQNMAQALQSMKKLIDFKVNHLYCFHGGHYAGEISPCIRELANMPLLV